MQIIEIKALPNGAHNNQTYHGVLPDGWAIVPEDMETPNFPFGEVEVEEVTHYRDVEVLREVTKTRQVPQYDEEGNPLPEMATEEYTEEELVTEQEPYTVMTVTKWTPGEIPAPVEPVLTAAEQRENAYNTRPLIDWEGETLTVTQAATKWQYYAAEGSEKADELQTLIAAAKQTIREQYPDEEVSV